MYAILKYQKRFEAVRTFTLESGQQEIERQNERRKAKNSFDSVTSPTPSQSSEDLHASSDARSSLSRIPEENGPFAIGGDDSDDERDGENTAPQSIASTQTSRRPSVSSTLDESVHFSYEGCPKKHEERCQLGSHHFLDKIV